MYCRFPKGYFFEVEELKGLIDDFEEESSFTRNFREFREDEIYDEDEIENIFEFTSTEDEDERHKNKCTDKDEKHKCKCKDKEQECMKNKKSKEEHKGKCNCADKCSYENKFFKICDKDYVSMVEKNKSCTLEYKKK